MQASRVLIRRLFPAVPQVAPDTLQGWIRNSTKPPPILLDCRPEEEHVVSHLAGARRVDPEADIESMKQTIRWIKETRPGDGVTVVCYCALGYRASKYATAIDKVAKEVNGDPRIAFHQLDGSLFQWANDNREMVDGHGNKTKYVHPFGGVFTYFVRRDLRKYEP